MLFLSLRGEKRTQKLQWDLLCISYCWASQVKNLCANAGDARDTVQSLGQEDTLEEEMATHSCILAWEMPWTEEPGGIQSMGSQRVGHDLMTKQQQQNYT